MENNKKLDIIDHVAVSVRDIDEAIKWYTKAFNCKVTYQDDTWAFIDFENMKLALVLPSQHPPHIAILREDAEKFGKLSTHRDGTRSCYLKDPAGNAVEVETLRQESDK